ncbi:arsenate reductase/protein-tyrosine-phosphatase family protein [Actinomadura rudentiformis]|uniref:ArsR family transcriptional regulator n=1 Tax=Actinomadura rudentiformis TaxID=359158 RepID=A0A6H9YMF0_9ACTN|nr:ArsR family transcriptional regulator [Actinomadura rudentiformis]KAB2347000.1 ArsR family transcriptional regulator [Actinomadura rudentiformis]
MVPSGPPAPAFVRMAAHPLRWRLLTELSTGDYRVRELVELLGHPQNLVSYHLRLLRGSGLVTSHRSSFDARDSYYHLDLERCADALAAAGVALHPALRLDPAPPSAADVRPVRARVLFACTGNSARSPVAEALLRHRTGGHVEVTSGGSHPKPDMHPNAVLVLREQYGIDIGDQRPRHLDTVTVHRFDRLISLCDKVREVRHEFSDHSRLIHWSIPDPAGGGYPVFSQMAAEIDTRIRYLLPVLAKNQEAQP